ncbi:MAG: hypothetical protein SFV19_17785 [Rhodospirillaceae bacterium]|nr:hypothetical protein [Rhodospirillaceae bacterium]
MDDWKAGGWLGSLGLRVAREIEEHLKTNPTIRGARQPLRMRFLLLLFGERRLLGFLLPYALLVVALVAAEVILAWCCNDLLPQWTAAEKISPLLKDVTSYFLGAQVTAIGLLFPIAVALVTLIVQRGDNSSTISEVQIYFSETLAYQVGASGIALSIVLGVQLLWSMQFTVHYFFEAGTSLQFFKIVLTCVHMVWFSVNLAAIWHFLFASLSYIRPAERAVMRKRFTAQYAIPADLKERLTHLFYEGAATSILPESKKTLSDPKAPSFFFGHDFRDWEYTEITDQGAAGKYLKDVWMRPLGWAIRRWYTRCKASPNKNKHYASGPALCFPVNFFTQGAQDGVVCRRQNGVPLDYLERFIIKHAFRYTSIAP